MGCYGGRDGGEDSYDRDEQEGLLRAHILTVSSRRCRRDIRNTDGTAVSRGSMHRLAALHLSVPWLGVAGKFLKLRARAIAAPDEGWSGLGVVDA